MRSAPVLSFAMLSLGGLAALPSAADCVFVNAGGTPSRIQAFAVGSGGALTKVPGSPFQAPNHFGGQGLITVGNQIYAIAEGGFKGTAGPKAIIAGGILFRFAIAPDCSLSQLFGAPTYGKGDHDLVATPDGTRLFLSNRESGSVIVLDIEPGGDLTFPVPSAPFFGEPTPLGLAVSPDGHRLFVSHGAAGLGVYDVAGDGALTPVAGSPFVAGGSRDFGTLLLTPTGSRLYAVDGGNSQIAGFSVGAGGALSPLPGSPVATGAGPDDLAFSPSRRLLFASNSTGGSLGVFAVALDGSLQPVPGSPFPASLPTGLALNPAGTVLYSIGSGQGYQVDAASVSAAGAISPIPGSPFAAGSPGEGSRLLYYPPAPGSASPEVPTLSPGAFAILVSLLALAAFRRLRRQA